MKVNNINNLKKAINDNESEIEIYGEIGDIVLKSGMVSNLMFFSAVLSVTAAVISVVSFIVWLGANLYFMMAVGVVSACAVIFSLTFMFTIKATQKMSLSLAIRLRKYAIHKSNNRIILRRK